jgi:hypothetical protein
MNKTMDELSDLFIKIGKKMYGSESGYAYTVGSVVGLVDFHLKYDPNGLQKAINRRFEEAEKELANL